MSPNVALTVNQIIQFLDASYSNKPAEQIDDYELVSIPQNEDFKKVYKEMTTNEKQYVKVYYSKKLNHCVVVHRGTNIKELNDVGFANCAIGMSRPCKYTNTRRYIVSEKIQKWAEGKFMQRNVTTLGHSQGSLLAALVGQESKEIIKIQPLHRKTYKDSVKEITIRSMNDFIDQRQVLSDPTMAGYADYSKIGKSDPAKHLYVYVKNKPKMDDSETIQYCGAKLVYDLDTTEHSYTIVLADLDPKMRIGLDAHLFTKNDEYVDPYITSKDENQYITLIKQIGIGVVIMGSMYLGYKWLNKKKSKKRRRSSRSSRSSRSV